jgi:predicted nucleic acid-binding protein
MYLLDTNVVSELRRAQPDRCVVAWLESVIDAHLHIAAVTLGELQASVEITRAQDSAKAAEIEAWLDQVAATFNILSLDATVFRCWARLMHGRSDDLLEDTMIAATAEVHQLTVITRNTRDFLALGAAVLDPFVWQQP